jgi:hypothetical protein
MRTLRVRKFIVIPVADIVEEDGSVIGELEGNGFPVYRGSSLFPVPLATKVESEFSQDRLEAFQSV